MIRSSTVTEEDVHWHAFSGHSPWTSDKAQVTCPECLRLAEALGWSDTTTKVTCTRTIAQTR